MFKRPLIEQLCGLVSKNNMAMKKLITIIGGSIGFAGLLFVFLSIFIFGEQVIFWLYTSDWISFPTSYLFFDIWPSLNEALGFSVKNGNSLDSVFEGIPRNKDGLIFIKFCVYPLYYFCQIKQFFGLEAIGRWLRERPDFFLEGIGQTMGSLQAFTIQVIEFLPLTLTFIGLAISLMITGIILSVTSSTGKNWGS